MLKRLGLWLLHYWKVVKPLGHGALLEKADLSRHVLRNIYSLGLMSFTFCHEAVSHHILVLLKHINPCSVD